MRTTDFIAFLAAALMTLAAIPSSASGRGGEACRRQWIAALAHDCGGDDAGKAREAVTQLRSIGQEGLDALCAEYQTLAAGDGNSEDGQRAVDPANATLERLRSAIDAVAKQHDAWASRLYWYTDLEAAKDQARRSGKPILSLRLLGNLDEDVSCANSRFFRSVLYANASVSDYLRAHFILHWESLRPVPRLTIDFGDGRRIERTITGNSIHYVLDADGAVIDAIPGLYGPQAFLAALKAGETAARQATAMGDAAQRKAFLCAYHTQGAQRIIDEWARDLSVVGAGTAAMAALSPALATPDAREAAPLAASKMRVEMPVLNALDPRAAVVDQARRVAGLESVMNQELWTKIAALHAGDASLDERSIALMKTKVPLESAEEAQRRTTAKRVIEDPFMRVLRTFEQSLASDTVRNERLFHRAIHQWLAEGACDSPAMTDVAAFNRRVYAELFLTPLDDPWMGLAPADAYAALDAGGCR